MKLETEVLTAEEVAHLLRLSPKTIRQQAAAGELPAKKIGKVWRFVRSDIEAYLRGSAPTGLGSTGEARLGNALGRAGSGRAR